MNALDRHCRRTITGSNELLHTYAVWLTPGEWQQTTARIAGSACTSLFVGTMVYGTPGLLWPLTGWWAVAGWRAGRRVEADDAQRNEAEAKQEAEEEQPDPKPSPPSLHDVRETVWTLGTPHIHISVLATALDTTPDRVREALATWEIPVEPVRMRGRGSSTGVKGDHFPAPRPAPVDVVAAGQATNNNTNNVTVTRHANGAHITVTPASLTVEKP